MTKVTMPLQIEKIHGYNWYNWQLSSKKTLLANIDEQCKQSSEKSELVNIVNNNNMDVLGGEKPDT